MSQQSTSPATPDGTLQVRVVSKRMEALDICSFELHALDGAVLPPFSAGSHIDVHVKPGLIRQYSLCNSPQERHRYVIGVLRDPASRGGSVAMHADIVEGGVITIGTPRNLFRLVDGAHPSLLLAGGIGITPLLAMAWQLVEDDADFHLHYFTRTAERAAFFDAIAMSPLKQHVSLWCDDVAAPARPGIGTLLAALSADAHVYACGPTGFLQHVLDSGQAAAWPAQQLHYEAFSAAASVAGAAFTVQLRSSGLAVQVGPEETIVAALLKHGVEIPVSCEQGICGTCLTGVVEGRPDHQDQYLTDDEHARGDQLTPCCSRSLTPLLVLDL